MCHLPRRTCVCRCRSDDFRHATAQAIRHEIEAICERRGVNCSMSIKHEAPAAACHPTMIASLVDACRASEQVIQSAHLSAWAPGDEMPCDFTEGEALPCNYSFVSMN